MKLVWIEVNSYRRFASPAKMDLNSKLIAVVGPNEAGKSSFLKALLHINSSVEFIASGASQELTRGASIRPDQIILEAGFLLEESDKRAISHISEAKDVRWLGFTKKVNGSFFYEATPRPKRDLKQRNLIIFLLKTLASKKRFRDLSNDESTEYSTAYVEALVDDLSVEREDLPQDLLDRIERLKDMLEKIVKDSDSKSIRGLPRLLGELYDYESEEHSHQATVNILAELIPDFLLFSDEDRSLQSSYDITPGVSYPKALVNLARLADLDLSMLGNAVEAGDLGQAETLIARANSELKEIFREVWSQSGIYVRLSRDGFLLNIFAGSTEATFVSIAERSDGLRQYIALLAFVSLREERVKPILLIDEAESHLHYDAQADLIQMLARQQVAAKVVYTTHSIGCLPEDLGTGVRLVEPSLANSNWSEIKNWFWENAEPGFSPLLFGMGASTLAFIPVRFALITEGASDLVLLPTMFREAVDVDHIGFQVVPGLANASESQITLLEKGARRTAHLVDSDEGGGKIAAKLKRAGVSQDHIIELVDGTQRGLVLEDFIDPIVYCNAINKLLEPRYGVIEKFEEKDLPEVNRPQAIKSWCKEKGFEELSKRSVAYQILEDREDSGIVWCKRKEALVDIYNAATKAISN